MQDWVGPALTDSALLVSVILLGACRTILRAQPDNTIVSRLAMQYEQSSIQSLIQSLSDVSLQASPLAIAKAVALVVDAVSQYTSPGTHVASIANDITNFRRAPAIRTPLGNT
jgi:hypothetical protein